MESFPSNSHNVLGETKTPKDVQNEKEKKDIQKVVVGEVIQKPKPITKRLKGIFFDGSFKNAAIYVLTDVIVPGIKNVIFDMINKGSDRVIFGDSQSRRRQYDPRRSNFSYNRPVDRDRDRYRTTMLPDQPPYSTPKNRKQEAGDVIIASKEEAELVLERLSDIIDKYDAASVADFHDLLGLPTNYVDNKWGWTRLTGVNVRQVREGYLIDLPGVEPI